MRRIGVHTSIAGGIHKGLERARELGCNTMQIFSHSPRGWAFRPKGADEIIAFKKLREEYDISPVFIHTSYLINLATNNSGLRKKSIDMVVSELEIADELGAEYVVLHTGSASGEDPETARNRAVHCLAEIAGKQKWRAGLLLENTAGERGDITSGIADLASIMEKVPDGLISGVCIDTCHAFAAGYDLADEKGVSLLSSEIGRFIGKDRLKLVHLNDSKGALRSGIDRHEHIGEGAIGVEGFRAILNNPFFKDVPLILETPKKTEDDDPRNLRTVRSLLE